VAAGGEGVALIDYDHAVGHVVVEELAQQGAYLLVADDLGLGIAQYQILDGGGVVGLHVMDEQVVQLAPAQSMGHVFKKCAGYGLIHCVEKNGLFVQQKIGVVGNAFGNAVNALKTGKTPVVGADPCQVVQNFFGAVHAI